MKKSQKGFTLVELIVVIAIIGVLAAILVPGLMGYVKKSKLKSANSNAKLVYTTINAAAADLIAEGQTKDATDVDCSVKKVSELDAKVKLEKAVFDALSENGTAAGSVFWDMKGTKILYAQWSDSVDKTGKVAVAGIVGQFPNPETDPDDENNIGVSIVSK